MKNPVSVAAFVCASVVLSRAGAESAVLPPSPLERASVERLVLARHPEVRAAESRATAARAEIDAEGHLPPPEVMGQVWQVPLERPYAVDRAGMVMVGVTQRFPAPGALGAREEARKSEAAAMSIMVSDRARLVAREAGHAFVDYAEASVRRKLHAEHERVERRLLDLARARHGAGGSLADAIRAEAELARTEADLTTDATRERTARARLNVLLGNPLDTPLGAASESPLRVPTESADALVTRALASRPEPKVAEAQTAAARSELAAARREANVPGFSLSALYFPPTAVSMGGHGYGASASMELPWLWGGGPSRARAREAMVRANETSAAAARLPVALDVVTAHTDVSRAVDRYRVLERRALPASKRAVDVATASYESGGASLLVVLESRRNLIDVEMAMLEAHTMLEHALVDLEAAVGGPVATRPLSEVRDEKEAHHGR